MAALKLEFFSSLLGLLVGCPIDLFPKILPFETGTMKKTKIANNGHWRQTLVALKIIGANGFALRREAVFAPIGRQTGLNHPAFAMR